MASYVLHVVDREKGLLKTGPFARSHSFDYLFEVLSGPHAGRRGSYQQLSDLLRDEVFVLSSIVGICATTGVLLDWKESDGVGRWQARQSRPLERVVGASD